MWNYWSNKLHHSFLYIVHQTECSLNQIIFTISLLSFPFITIVKIITIPLFLGSVYSVVAVALERYFNICKPFNRNLVSVVTEPRNRQCEKYRKYTQCMYIVHIIFKISVRVHHFVKVELDDNFKHIWVLYNVFYCSLKSLCKDYQNILNICKPFDRH